jgi:hypothetical protein
MARSASAFIGLVDGMDRVCAVAKLADEHPVSLNEVFAQNLCFLDRDEGFIYP